MIVANGLGKETSVVAYVSVHDGTGALGAELSKTWLLIGFCYMHHVWYVLYCTQTGYLIQLRFL